MNAIDDSQAIARLNAIGARFTAQWKDGTTSDLLARHAALLPMSGTTDTLANQLAVLESVAIVGILASRVIVSR